MTCVVGYVHDGAVYMVADSAGVAGSGAYVLRRDPKIFRLGDFLIGYTSSFRMGQLLRYNFEPPRRYDDEDIYTYMCTRFINAVRDCLKSGGYAASC